MCLPLWGPSSDPSDPRKVCPPMAAMSQPKELDDKLQQASDYGQRLSTALAKFEPGYLKSHTHLPTHTAIYVYIYIYMLDLPSLAGSSPDGCIPGVSAVSPLGCTCLDLFSP
jgi:hypothetical protein